MPRRGEHHDPGTVRQDRSWALRAFLLASLLWIAYVTVMAFAWGRDDAPFSRIGFWVYACFLLLLVLLALAAAGTAAASLLARRRGKRIAGAALLMSLPPLGLSVFSLLKLFFEQAG